MRDYACCDERKGLSDWNETEEFQLKGKLESVSWGLKMLSMKWKCTALTPQTSKIVVTNSSHKSIRNATRCVKDFSRCSFCTIMEIINALFDCRHFNHIRAIAHNSVFYSNMLSTHSGEILMHRYLCSDINSGQLQIPHTLISTHTLP